MRLIQCHIENFGGLHDTEVEFNSDFHLIREPNGWGKSTLAAFIRVMFFGFEGEGKRSTTENERKRFAPWQGGIYGGQITFETGGRTYTAARIFSDKKANDSFELRDAQTNLTSDDFSENLGEEIFRINGESFARTVFIGQNDCATYATDSINAKIGNITDNLNDLESYEKASAALQNTINKLSPRRKTGRLYKLNDQVTRLQTDVTQHATVEDSIRECMDLETKAKSRLDENRRQQKKLLALSGQAAKAQEQKTKREEYSRLCAACAQTEEAYQKAREKFPGEVLSEEELNSCIDACDEMSRAAEGMRNYALTPEERDQLQSLEQSDDTDKEAAQNQSSTAPGRWIALFVCGIALAAVGLGVFFGVGRAWGWIAVAVVGVILLVIGLVLWQRGGKKAAEETARLQRIERELAASRSERLEMLAEKQRDYRDCQTRYEQEQTYMKEQISRMGLTLNEAPKIQLQEIWRQRVALQSAEAALQDARQKKQEFESENAERDLTTAEDTGNLPSLEDLNGQLTQLTTEEDALRDQADIYDKQLTSLHEAYDAWIEAGERLEETKEERSRTKRQFDQARTALACLTTAKEAMTAKYMEPLMKSFSEYYRILTEVPGGPISTESGGDFAVERFRMDANTNLTVEEYGLQRETDLLSRGWQDLIGLCLRLALVDAMYSDERPFLLLDDPLVNLDEQKREGGRRLMRALAGRYQIIYFTCQEVREI
ncbi:MAG: AAA family ATPase [Lachnospiraceae bacterium]|nr:AAA family ATPase [Lachnospiraceae bacterium]